MVIVEIDKIEIDKIESKNNTDRNYRQTYIYF